jgi:hypothetical protein
MSIFNLPRAHFSGTFMTNPCTTNNDDINYLNNYVDMTVNNPQGLPDPQFKQFLMSLKTGTGTPFDNKYINAGWNYFGDNGTDFTDPQGNPARITMARLLGDVSPPANDPFLSATINLAGMFMGDNRMKAVMVDCDPASSFSVQIFAGAVEINGADGSPMLTAEGSFACYARWMFMSRTPQLPPDQASSVVWQFGIPTSELQIDQTALANSPTLQAFARALGGAGVQGLTLQFDIYEVTPTYTPLDLYNQFFSKGIDQINPAFGNMTGTLGLWNAGEVGTMPGGRILYPIIPTPPPGTPPQQTADAPQPLPQLGQAAAWIDTSRRVVLLNLANTIPQSAPGQGKYYYGDLQLAISYFEGGVYKTAPLATLYYQSSNPDPYASYNETAYRQSGGFMQVSYAGSPGEAYINNGQLLITVGSTPHTHLCAELPFASAMVDQFGLYVTAGETITIPIRTEFGGLPKSAHLTAQEFRAIVYPPKDPNCPGSLSGGGFACCQLTVPVSAANPSIVQFNPSFTTDANGNYNLAIKALAPGLSFIRFVPDQPSNANPDAQQLYNIVSLIQNDNDNPMNTYPSWQYDFYMVVRVLPTDANLDSIPDAQLIGEAGWNNVVYPIVFRYYYLLYPAMSKRIDMSNYPSMQSFAGLIARLIGSSNEASTTYMPITRELSDGKRRLIQRWCALNS